MFTGKKRVFLTATLIFLLTFAFVSSASAHTTVNWTVKYNGQEVPGNYVWHKGAEQPAYKIQIPLQLGTGDGKAVFYYTINPLKKRINLCDTTRKMLENETTGSIPSLISTN